MRGHFIIWMATGQQPLIRAWHVREGEPFSQEGNAHLYEWRVHRACLDRSTDMQGRQASFCCDC